MARFAFEAFPRALDSNADPVSGAKLYVFDAGTTTPATVYSDLEHSTAHAHPIVADASGFFGGIYAPEGSYKVRITTDADVLIYEADNIAHAEFEPDLAQPTFKTVAALLSDTTLSYTRAAGKVVVAAGDYVAAGDMLYEVAASGASDHQESTGNSVKLYEAGLAYTTFDRFKAADARSALDGAPAGATVKAAGATYVKDSAQTFIPGLTGWRAPWMVQKHLLSSDWQPRTEASSPGEAARLQSVLDSIAARHPDLYAGHVLGDLVTDGSVDSTGAAPEYGFPEFKADWRTRLPIPLHRAFFLPGNHDRDGTGAGSHKKAWSMQSYRSFIGPEFYHTTQGNLVNIYMGDMGGSTGGAITDAVAAWLRPIVFRHQNDNIIWNVHQPYSGTYLGDTSSDGTQAGSSRFTDILDEVAAGADNIAAVFFGHKGSANQFNRETHHGTEHIQIGMHIPSNVDNARNDQYYVMELVHGASTFDIVQWDATADTELATETITLKYPLQLGPEIVRHEPSLSIEPVRVAVPLDEYVEDTGGGAYAVPENTEVVLGDFRFEDRANLANPDDLEAVFNFGWGLINTGGDSDASAASPAHEKAAQLVLARINGAGSGTAPTLSWGCRAEIAGVLTDFWWADDGGIHLGHNGNTTSNPASVQSQGSTVGSTGFASAYNPSGVSGYWGRDGVGNIFNFYDTSGYIGTLENAAGTLTLTTASDHRLKTLKRKPKERDPWNEIKRLGKLSCWFEYKNYPGSLQLGWMAHEMATVRPDAVSGVKDEVYEDGSPKYQQRRDAKLIPELTVVLGQALERIEQLEARVKELEGKA